MIWNWRLSVFQRNSNNVSQHIQWKHACVLYIWQGLPKVSQCIFVLFLSSKSCGILRGKSPLCFGLYFYALFCRRFFLAALLNYTLHTDHLFQLPQLHREKQSFNDYV